MGCGCRERKNGGEAKSASPTPTTQCLYCAQKHADEAAVAMKEFTYDVENRSFIHGSLRAVVLHTFRGHRDIADVARRAALAWQRGDRTQAEKLLEQAIGMIYRRIDDEQELQLRHDG